MGFYLPASSPLPIPSSSQASNNFCPLSFLLLFSSVNSMGSVSVIHLGTVIFPLTPTVDSSRTSHELSLSHITTSSNSDVESNNRDGNYSSSSTSSNMDDAAPRPVSNTAVVDELIETVVFPALYLDPRIHLKGVLLLGPPGVGKTFSIKALKTYCKSICKVRFTLSAHPQSYMSCMSALPSCRDVFPSFLIEPTQDFHYNLLSFFCHWHV